MLNLTADVVGRVRVTGLAERVVALGRSFHGYSFLDYVGELDLEYPSFGCDELVRSSCYASQVHLCPFVLPFKYLSSDTILNH